MNKLKYYADRLLKFIIALIALGLLGVMTGFYAKIITIGFLLGWNAL